MFLPKCLFPVWQFLFLFLFLFLFYINIYIKVYFTPFTFRGRNSSELSPFQLHKAKSDLLSLFKTSIGNETVLAKTICVGMTFFFLPLVDLELG